MSVDIRFCDDRDVPSVMAFIDAHFRAGHPLAHHRSLFDWQYGNPGQGNSNLVVASDGSSSDVLGILGFVDAKRYDPNLAANNCIWLALWQVKPGIGLPYLGPALFRFLQERVRHQWLAVSGVRTALTPLYRAMGFRVIELAHYVLLNPDVREHHLAVVPAATAEAKRAALSDVGMRALSREELFDLGDELETPLDRAPQKSARYFYHRYLCHPFYTYSVYVVTTAGRPVGLVAARIASHHGWRALRIVDVLLDSAYVARLGHALLGVLAETQGEYADFLQAGIDDACLREAGFAPVDPASGVVVPNYFEPFVRENTHITACVRGPQSDRFIVCKGDGDQDRPSVL